MEGVLVDAISHIGINRNSIRVVLNARKWTRSTGWQWVERAEWFDVPPAYRDEFRLLACMYGEPRRQMHTGTLEYYNCGIG